jgi:hypothetical protein
MLEISSRGSCSKEQRASDDRFCIPRSGESNAIEQFRGRKASTFSDIIPGTTTKQYTKFIKEGLKYSCMVGLYFWRTELTGIPLGWKNDLALEWD